MTRQEVDDIYDDRIDNYLTASKGVSEHEAMNALAQKLDRILTGRVSIEVETSTSISIAASTTTKVLFNHYTIEQMARGKTQRDKLAMFLAVNIHEVGHLHFTPNWQNDVWQDERVKHGGSSWNPATQAVDSALNMLEDQRQELLEGVRHPKARDWQRLALVGMLEKWGETDALFALFYGRRHLLPKEVMVRIEARYRKVYGDAATERTKEIISEFQKIVPNDDLNLRRMYRLAEELNSITNGSIPAQRCTSEKKSGGTIRGKEQAEVSKKAADALEKYDEDEQAKSEQEQAEPDKPGDEAAQPGPSKPSVPDKSDKKAIDEALESMTERVMDRLEDDMDDNIQTVNDLMDGYGAGEEGDGGKEVPIDPSYLNDAVRLSRLFREIALDLQKKDHRNMKSGRLDIRRLSTCLAQNSSRMFKKRTKDMTNEARLAIAVMFDVSSSMSGWTHSGQTRAEAAAQAAFSIAKGAELAGHVVQIEKFNQQTRLVKSWKSKKYSSSVNGTGGTDPYFGILANVKELERIGNSEGVTNRVLIIATDGDFSRKDDVSAVFRRLKKMGVHVFIIGIGYESDRVYNPRTQEYDKVNPYPTVEVSKVDDATDLFGAMKDILSKLEIAITKDIKSRMV